MGSNHLTRLVCKVLPISIQNRWPVISQVKSVHKKLNTTSTNTMNIWLDKTSVTESKSLHHILQFLWWSACGYVCVWEEQTSWVLSSVLLQIVTTLSSINLAGRILDSQTLGSRRWKTDGSKAWNIFKCTNLIHPPTDPPTVLLRHTFASWAHCRLVLLMKALKSIHRPCGISSSLLEDQGLMVESKSPAQY